MSEGNGTDQRTQEIEKRIDKDIAGAIQLYGSPAGAATIAPKNLVDVMEFAKLMAVSGPCVRPAFRGSPGACLAIALQAFRTGADPFAVANKAYITTSRSGDEQISYEAQYIHAVLNTSGKLTKRLRATYSGAGQKRKCTIIGHVVGEDEPLEYESPSIEEIAVKNSPLWKSDPDQQLFYYSSRAWGRRHLPEVLLGMYTPDEVRGEVIDVTPGPAAPRPRPEDYATKEQIAPEDYVREEAEQTEVDAPRFQVVDSVGDVAEYATEMEAIEELIALVGEMRSIASLEELSENNPTLAHFPSVIEAYKDQKEALTNSAGATGRTEHPEERQSSTPNRKEDTRRSSPSDENPDAAPRDEPGSLAVPLRKVSGSKTDWPGTKADMLVAIAGLTDPADVAPNGAFVQANREGLDLMRFGDKAMWSEVMYRLGDRERALKGGEP